MSEDNIKETAKELFTSDPQESLEEQLPRMEGWFDVTDGQIRFDVDLDDLTKGQSYLAYLTAAYVAYLAEERESQYISHSEANKYFGWKKSEGRSAAQYASKYSNFLNTDSGEKSIAPHRLKEVIDILEEQFSDA